MKTRACFAVAILLELLAGCANSAAALHGTVLQPPKPAPTYVLVDQRGRRFDSRRLKGHPVALFFGFTHCKDVCPQTLALLGKAAVRSGPAGRTLRIVMISADPRGDSPASMRGFIARAGVRNAIGLTGSAAALRRVWRAYGVSVYRTPGDIVHSDLIYLIDRTGRLRELLHPDVGLSDLVADLHVLATDNVGRPADAGVH